MLKKVKTIPILRAALVGGVVTSSLGIILLLAPLGEGIERWSYDLPFQFISAEPGTNVVILYMDEESHGELGQQFNTAWDRDLHTRLVRRLTEDHARLIFFDFAFSDIETNKDSQFAAAIREHGKVFLGATQTEEGLGVLNHALTNAAHGCGPFYLDPKDTCHGVRRIWTGTPAFPAEVWLAAKEALRTLKEEDRLTERWLNYYGEPGSLPWKSYYKAVNTNLISPGFFRDKCVFIGGRVPVSFIGAYQDQFLTPYSHFAKAESKLAAGVEIHATAFLNLWAGDWLKRFPLFLELGILALTGLGLGWGLTMLRPLPAVIVAISTALVICFLALILVRNRFWFSWLHIVGLQIPLAFAWSITWNAIRAHVDKQVLMASLSVYFSPARVKQILRHPELLKPGATGQEVSILFSDIAGFSKIAEMKRPEDMVRLLNKYYENAIQCIHATDGTVMDLIGDAIFAIWNAPQKQQDHRSRACEAALLLQAKLVWFDETGRDLPLHTRVGLHTGVVCVGNIGSPTRFNYTAIGDSVNMAARLEGLNKHLGTVTLATRDIQVAIESQFVCRLAGYFRFKGMSKAVEVYELVGPIEKEAETKQWREPFAEGLHLFQRKHFDAAEAKFNHTLKSRPDDGPAKFYIKQINKLRSKELPDDWKGEVELSEK